MYCCVGLCTVTLLHALLSPPAKGLIHHNLRAVISPDQTLRYQRETTANLYKRPFALPSSMRVHVTPASKRQMTPLPQVSKKTLGTLRSNGRDLIKNARTATAGKTSLKKWTRGFSIFNAIFPSRLLCRMYANSPGVEFLRALSKLRKRKKISSLLVYVPYKTWN